MLSADAASGALVTLRADDFYRPTHGKLFDAMRRLVAQGRECDQLTVSDATDVDKSYILEVAANVPTSANWRHYADIVKRDALRREVINRATEVTALAYDSTDTDALLSEAESIVSPQNVSGGTRTIAQIVEANLDTYSQPREFYQLGEWGVRLRKGGLAIVGARPSVGKTAFALQEAHNLASRHVKTRIYSYEESDEDWSARAVARSAGFSAEELDDGLAPHRIQAVKEAMTQDWCRFVSVTDAIGWPIGRVIADMRRFARAGGKVVFIDYLQLMVKQSYEDVTEASRQLKVAARQTGLSLVALSQLSRRVAGGDGKLRAPSLTDLRQSGALEQDADIVLLLHAYEKDDEEIRPWLKQHRYLVADPAHVAHTLSHVHVAKNRRGKRDVLMPAFFDGENGYWTRMNQEAR